MEKNTRKRWYDKNPELSGFFERLKDFDPARRESMIGDLKDLITSFDDGLIDDNVMEFPLTTKRRWYDSDPYAWLVINALKYADDELINRVIVYFKEKNSGG